MKMFFTGPIICSLFQKQVLELMKSFLQIIFFLQFVASNGGAYTTPRPK